MPKRTRMLPYPEQPTEYVSGDKSAKCAIRIFRASFDPAYGSPKEQLGHELFDWHSGMVSGLYAVAMALMNKQDPSIADVRRAVVELRVFRDQKLPAAEAEHVADLFMRLKGLEEEMDSATSQNTQNT